MIRREAEARAVFYFCPGDDLGEHEGIGKYNGRAMPGNAVAFANRGIDLLADENADLEPYEGIKKLGDTLAPFVALSFKNIDEEGKEKKRGPEDVCDLDVCNSPKGLLDRMADDGFVKRSETKGVEGAPHRIRGRNEQASHKKGGKKVENKKPSRHRFLCRFIYKAPVYHKKSY